MNLGRVNQKVDQLGVDMGQFMRQMSGQGPQVALRRVRAGHRRWRQARAAVCLTPLPSLHLNAPMAMSTEMREQSDFGRIARGSAGVAELVAMMEQQPCISVESFETFAMRKTGVFSESQPWSVAKLAKEHVAQVDGHPTLQKTITILGQISISVNR